MSPSNRLDRLPDLLRAGHPAPYQKRGANRRGPLKKGQISHLLRGDEKRRERLRQALQGCIIFWSHDAEEVAVAAALRNRRKLAEQDPLARHRGGKGDV